MSRANKRGSTLSYIALAVATGVVALCAQTSALAGDGSGASNPDLLRGPINAGCTNPKLCDAPVAARVQPPAKQNIAPVSLPVLSAPLAIKPIRPANCDALIKASIYTADCQGQAAVVPAGVPMERAVLVDETQPIILAPATRAAVSRVPAPALASAPSNAVVQSVPEVQRSAPPFAVDQIATGSVARPVYAPTDDAIMADWALTLRGSFISNNAGKKYEALAMPSGSLTLQRLRGTTSLNGDTSLSQSSNGSFRIGAGNFSVLNTQALDPLTKLNAGLRLSVSQEGQDVTTASTIATQPFVIVGSGEVGLAHDFGRLSADVQGKILRQYVSETGLLDGSWSTNNHRAYWGMGGSVRAAYEITPIVSLYGRLLARRSQFDTPSPTLGVLEDAWTYEARSGLTASWRSGLSGEVYGGYAFRQFDSASLSSNGGWIYGGRLTYAPERGFTLSAALDNALSSEGDVSGAAMRFDRTLSFDASYQANQQTTLRAKFSTRHASFSNSTSVETDYRIGGGLDYSLNKNAALNADYSFLYEDLSGQTDNTHRVSLGVTVKR